MSKRKALMRKGNAWIGFVVALGVGAVAMSAVLNSRAADVAVAAYIGATVIAGWLAVLHSSSFRDVLTEKNPDAIAATTFEPPASFSRLVGIVGAAMLVAFLWAYGLLTLVNLGSSGKTVEKIALMGDEKIALVAKAGAAIADQVNIFFYVGLALFAPYAANQLARVLAARGQSASMPEQSAVEDQLDKEAQASPPPA